MPPVGPRPAPQETWEEQLFRLRMMADPDDLEFSNKPLQPVDRAAIRDLLREFESGPTLERRGMLMNFAMAALIGMLMGWPMRNAELIRLESYEHALAMTQLFDEYAAQLGKK